MAPPGNPTTFPMRTAASTVLAPLTPVVKNMSRVRFVVPALRSNVAVPKVPMFPLPGMAMSKQLTQPSAFTLFRLNDTVVASPETVSPGLLPTLAARELSA